VSINTPRVGILSTFGRATNTTSFLSRLVAVESSLAEVVHVIAPDAGWAEASNVVFHRVRYQVGRNPLAQVFNQTVAQVAMAFRLVRLTGRVDHWIFYGGDFLLLPGIVARLFRVRFLVALAGNLEREAQLKKSMLSSIEIALRRIVFAAADGIILYSETLVAEWHLDRYRSKIMIADSHFLDFEKFREECPLGQRARTVGYIGRLSDEKGVLNLVKAIPQVLRDESSVRFVIVGSGPLQDVIRGYLAGNSLEGHVTLVDHVPREAVTGYLNTLSLCVLPSYTEGMPNIVLEAMACGTPVLATPVGAIRDLIDDGQTGFLMADNTPDCIASNIIRSLRFPGLEAVAAASKRSVERRFSFDAARESFGRIASGMTGRYRKR
jgi:glycosyltransferase involved in cell wall biosynthesis